jgi:hypothetical protein
LVTTLDKGNIPYVGMKNCHIQQYEHGIPPGSQLVGIGTLSLMNGNFSACN